MLSDVPAAALDDVQWDAVNRLVREARRQPVPARRAGSSARDVHAGDDRRRRRCCRTTSEASRRAGGPGPASRRRSASRRRRVWPASRPTRSRLGPGRRQPAALAGAARRVPLHAGPRAQPAARHPRAARRGRLARARAHRELPRQRPRVLPRHERDLALAAQGRRARLRPFLAPAHPLRRGRAVRRAAATCSRSTSTRSRRAPGESVERPRSRSLHTATRPPTASRSCATARSYRSSRSRAGGPRAAAGSPRPSRAWPKAITWCAWSTRATTTPPRHARSAAPRRAQAARRRWPTSPATRPAAPHRRSVRRRSFSPSTAFGRAAATAGRDGRRPFAVFRSVAVGQPAAVRVRRRVFRGGMGPAQAVRPRIGHRRLASALRFARRQGQSCDR